MLPCPVCRGKLTRAPLRGGEYWGCGSCGGRAATVPALKRSLPRGFVEELWASTEARTERRDRRCPFCAAFLRDMVVRHGGRAHALDFCDPCQLVWFDGEEFEDAGREGAPAASAAPAAADGPVGPDGMTVRDRVEAYKALAALREEASGDAEVRHPWEFIPMLLGLPIETGRTLRGRPWATWSLAAVTLAVGIATILGDLDGAVAGWGFVPAEPLRRGGLTLLTSFLLHGGWLHLLSNLYFLVVFGDDVEEFLGPARFLLLLLAATVAGDLLYALLAWGSAVPSVGASGGISGVIAFYALRFPRARLKVFFVYYFRARGFSLTARDAFLLWVGLQFLGAWMQAGGWSRVNAFAHLGGAAVGVALWWKWREGRIALAPARGGR